MAPKDENGTAKSVNALLDILSAAGLDTVDNHFLDREVERCVVELRRSRESLPQDPQVWDCEVEKLIRQLRESLRDAPERDIIDDLLEDTEMLRHSVPEPEPEYAAEPPSWQEVKEEKPSEDRKQYLEREFSSTSFPKIGPGYSDSISIVSDLTMPTTGVAHGEAPPEEEKYGGLPLSIGFARKPRSQLRRPSLEDKSSGRGSSSGDRKQDRRAAQQQLKPPSRREVTRPGGAAANRRQNHQATMAHLEAATPVVQGGRSSKSDQKAKSVNDFPSLSKDASRGSGETPQGSEKRSLLRKSNKYAAFVSVTASQRMLIARQEDAKKKRHSNRRRSTGENDGSGGTKGFASAGYSDDFGFDYMQPKEEPKTGVDSVLIDEDGFIIGADPQSDPFGASAFDADFPPTLSFDANFNSKNNASVSSINNGSSSSFFLASVKDTKKKKGSSRRASMTGKTAPGKLKKKDQSRIDAVEKATKKKLDVLRKAAEQQGDSAFGYKVDAVEQETMKQIRRIRDHYN